MLGAAVLGAPGVAPAADDTALFSSVVPPNVLFLVDNSESMYRIIEHPAFDANHDYKAECDGNGDSVPGDPPAWMTASDSVIFQPGDPTFSPGTHTYCGYTREIYGDPRIFGGGLPLGGATYGTNYLAFLFSAHADQLHDLDQNGSFDEGTVVDQIASDSNGSFSDCRLGLPLALFKRTRITAARDTVNDLACELDRAADARVGVAVLRHDATNPDGGHVTVPAAPMFYDHDGLALTPKIPFVYFLNGALRTHAAHLDQAFQVFPGDPQTPLSEALFQAYTYFHSPGGPSGGDPRSSSKLPYGDADGDGEPGEAGDLQFPLYAYGTSLTGGGQGGANVGASSAPRSPVQYFCQKNFVVVVTDSEPRQDNFAVVNDPSLAGGFGDFDTLIGDYNPDGEVEVGNPADPGCDGNCVYYLDDIAKFMQEQDLAPDAANSAYPGRQNVSVYTIGIGTNPATEDLLERTAKQGGGTALTGFEPAQARDQLIEVLEDIVEQSQSFTAATVPASRASDGSNFYATYFNPSDTSPFWPGHLKLFAYSGSGEVRDAPTAAQLGAGEPGDCALDDPVPGRCRAGRLRIELDGFWDAADEIPLATQRNLFVSKYQGGPPATVPDGSGLAHFDEADVTASDLGVGLLDIPSFSGIGAGIAGILSGELLADAIVRYIRGCEFGLGSCQDRGDGQKLWDIFHSSPVSVGPPNLGLRNPSYREFAVRYRHRKRIVYAGSNGGFVHGFNAGEHDTVAAPGVYDRGNGSEVVGFMAYPARQKIAQLPLDFPPRGGLGWSGYTMDGPPAVADVWLYPDPQVAPEDVVSNPWNRWRTVLAGGMRQGGRVYWALDVTNPPDHNSPSGEQSTGPSYPGYLWEFPCESSDARCTGSGVLPAGRSYAQYMGETWAEPILTRVRVTVNCAGSCPTYDRWVALVPGGYDPKGDPNHAGYDASSNAGTSRAGRAVFMIDVTTGEVLAMRRYSHVSTSGDPEMKYAFVGSPSVFDIDADGYADVAYFGDLGGNLWKWVLHDPAADAINGVGDVQQAWDGTKGWKWFKLFSAFSCTGTDTDVSESGCNGGLFQPDPHYRSFFSPPTGALVGPRLWLGFGSGERNDLDFVGTLDKEKNRFYVLHDDDPFERELALPAAGQARYSDDPDRSPLEMVDANGLSGACTAPPPPAVGYYVQGEAGEKFIGGAEILFGVVLTGSYKPPGATTNPCLATGDSFLYGMELFCGAGALPPPGGVGADIRRVRLGAGMPNRPRISVGPVASGEASGASCEDMVVVVTSEGESFSECPGGRPSSGVKVRSWRDD